MNNFTIEVGDLIEVINSGFCYDTYNSWAERNELQHWKRKACPEDKGIYKVKKIGLHGDGDGETLLYGIELDYISSCIMGKKGIKLFKKREIQLEFNF
jgi:hypothetical protein